MMIEKIYEESKEKLYYEMKKRVNDQLPIGQELYQEHQYLFSKKEAAKYCEDTVGAFEHYTAIYNVPCFKIGNRTCYSQIALDRYILLRELLCKFHI